MLKLDELNVQGLLAEHKKTDGQLKKTGITRVDLIGQTACLATKAKKTGDRKTEEEAIKLLAYFSRHGSKNNKKIAARFLRPA